MKTWRKSRDILAYLSPPPTHTRDKFAHESFSLTALFQIHQKLLCTAAVALLFAACAGSAWAVELTGPVMSSPTVEGEYIITSQNSDGVFAYSNDIIIGASGTTQKIYINVNYTNAIGVSSLVNNSNSSVTLNANENEIHALDSSGLGLSSRGAGGYSSEITLNSGNFNSVSGVSFGAYSYAQSSGSSKVTLNAGGFVDDGTVGYSNLIYSSEGNGVYSYADGGSSEIALNATADNGLNYIGANGIYAVYSGSTDGTSIVTLTAATNDIEGANYAIAAISDDTAGSNASVILSAQSNLITSYGIQGVAVFAQGHGTVDITGTTTLEAYAAARADSGGQITFNDNVTFAAPLDGESTTATYAAYVDGQDSEITFAEGLSNAGYDSIIRAVSGGTVTVNANGTGIVNYTGTTNISAPDTSYTEGTINMALGSGSVWDMTGDSSATSLSISDSGLLNMTADNGAFSTLTLNTLSGDGGTIHMDIDASTGTGSDRLLVGTHDGTHYITLNNVSASDPTDSVIGSVLVSVGDEQGEFKANDNEGTLYWERYTLDSQESATDGYNTDWYLAEAENVNPDEKETTTVNTVMSASSLNYHSWMMQNAKMLERLADLRQGANNGINGSWFRVSGSKLTMGGDHGFENEYMRYELGYDKIFEQTSKYTIYGGIALTLTDGESLYNSGDGDNGSQAVNLYFTQINKGGSYLDLVLKLGSWQNDFTAYDTNYNRIYAKTESTGMSVSAELGKKFALGNRGLYIEPQAQLTYGHFDGDSYTVTRGSEQVNVHADGIHSLVGRAGFNLGWDINPRSNVYLKANVLHEFLGDYAIVMNDGINTPLSRTGDYSDTWFLYGLGASFKLGKQNSGNFLHFDVERSTGGDLDQEWFYNVGFRFEM